MPTSAIVTDPADYEAVLAAIGDAGWPPQPLRRRLAVAAFRHTAAYDARIALELSERLEPSPDGGLPAHFDLSLDRSLELRYGENPHQSAAMYLLPGTDPAVGPFARGVDVRGGKALSYNNLLDAAAALRSPGTFTVRHARSSSMPIRAVRQRRGMPSLPGKARWRAIRSARSVASPR